MKLPAIALRHLQQSGIDASTATRLHIAYQKAGAIPGIPVPSIRFPYFQLDGTPSDFYRDRLLEDYIPPKQKKPLRYRQPARTPSHLYLPPLLPLPWTEIAKDAHVPIYITEGEKKAACACKHGFPTIGIGGAWNWQAKKQPLAELASVNWAERHVAILFDSDSKRNAHVQHAQERLAADLRGRGAVVRVVQLPDDGKGKVGLDDFLLAKGEAGLKELLCNTESEAKSADDVVKELNERHAVVMVGGDCVVLTEVIDPVRGQPDITLSRISDMQHKYANRLVADGGKQVNAFTHWMRSPSRRDFDRIVFAPSGDVRGSYNLWRGFAVLPLPGDCSLFLAHIHDNICKGDAGLYNYVLAWFATMVQRPSDRPGVSIALRGKQGAGKTFVADTIGSLFGQHYVRVTSARHLTGNFNAHLRNALLVCADEAFWAGDKSAEGVLKSMVTDDVHMIEFKGRDAFAVKNHIWLLIASNHEWLVPAGLEERRFCVIEVADTQMQKSGYFRAIADQLDNGGREALLHELLTRDVSNVDLRALPDTSALRENKLLSMSPVQRFVFEMLAAGANDGSARWVTEVPIKTVYERYLEASNQVGDRRRANETEMGMHLRKLMPGLKRKRRSQDSGTGSKRQVYTYQFPPLKDCRAVFEREMRSKFDWEDPFGSRDG